MREVPAKPVSIVFEFVLDAQLAAFEMLNRHQIGRGPAHLLLYLALDTGVFGMEGAGV